MGVLNTAQSQQAYEKCSPALRGARHTLSPTARIPDAMTGSFMSSLVIGQMNSSGIPEERESILALSSSILLRTLLRSPRDSERRSVTLGSKGRSVK